MLLCKNVHFLHEVLALNVDTWSARIVTSFLAGCLYGVLVVGKELYFYEALGPMVHLVQVWGWKFSWAWACVSQQGEDV